VGSVGRTAPSASLGTLQNRLERVFRIIAEASAGQDAQLVIALGCKTARIPSNLLGDPIVVGYSPQMALLRRASLVITHGGLNTTLECLSEGLPLVVLPITNDQPGVAARIKHLGVGEYIPLKKLTASGLRRTVRSVQTSPFYRERARRCADEIQRADGPTQAAELIEKAFSSRQRVQRSSASTLPPRSDAAR
jgi:MGT family glycosyltransferase